METQGYAVHQPGDDFQPFTFQRREVGKMDILIEIIWAGICHSDIHQAKDDWGGASYPMVPGHEIVGKVTRIGDGVTKFKVGDFAGVGCMVDSCRNCHFCQNHEENFCRAGVSYTYNSKEQDKKTPTYGGYSTQIVVDEKFGIFVPKSLEPKLHEVAPLLCAGITVYSPLARFEKQVVGGKVGVVGLGGLGHMAVKIAAAMGAEVTVFSTSSTKEADARSWGASHFVNTKQPGVYKPLKDTLDVIIDTVSADHPVSSLLDCCKPYGACVLVGLPSEPLKVKVFSLVNGNKILTGSNIGGIKETQEMMDFCAKHNITSSVEEIKITDLKEAYARTMKSDVKYRFVIDIASLRK
eukprot:TRINITY_DN17155_c0_g1_i1.p1 TRINITY_DN17155_c0_g1~~TRINITY_DN17155_c0_g1_i1.p1  ORF type:complete len:381 (-),score=65.44 TRINITY_DN17155_c0_g1_i1:239-1294(-)